jgi:hypothetical protein
MSKLLVAFLFDYFGGKVAPILKIWGKPGGIWGE